MTTHLPNSRIWFVSTLLLLLSIGPFAESQPGFHKRVSRKYVRNAKRLVLAQVRGHLIPTMRLSSRTLERYLRFLLLAGLPGQRALGELIAELPTYLKGTAKIHRWLASQRLTPAQRSGVFSGFVRHRCPKSKSRLFSGRYDLSPELLRIAAGRDGILAVRWCRSYFIPWSTASRSLLRRSLRSLDWRIRLGALRLQAAVLAFKKDRSGWLNLLADRKEAIALASMRRLWDLALTPAQRASLIRHLGRWSSQRLHRFFSTEGTSCPHIAAGWPKTLLASLRNQKTRTATILLTRSRFVAGCGKRFFPLFKRVIDNNRTDALRILLSPLQAPRGELIGDSAPPPRDGWFMDSRARNLVIDSMALLQHADQQVRYLALRWLVFNRSTSAQVISALRNLVRSPTARIRRLAIIALLNGNRKKLVRSLLLAEIKRQSTLTREAIRWLVDAGEASRAFVRLLFRATASEDKTTRRWSVWALGELRPRSAKVVRRIGRLVADPVASVRRSARFALQQFEVKLRCRSVHALLRNRRFRPDSTARNWLQGICPIKR